jgi:hypothetical protein
MLFVISVSVFFTSSLSLDFPTFHYERTWWWLFQSYDYERTWWRLF